MKTRSIPSIVKSTLFGGSTASRRTSCGKKRGFRRESPRNARSSALNSCRQMADKGSRQVLILASLRSARPVAKIAKRGATGRFGKQPASSWDAGIPNAGRVKQSSGGESLRSAGRRKPSSRIANRPRSSARETPPGCGSGASVPSRVRFPARKMPHRWLRRDTGAPPAAPPHHPVKPPRLERRPGFFEDSLSKFPGRAEPGRRPRPSRSSVPYGLRIAQPIAGRLVHVALTRATPTPDGPADGEPRDRYSPSCHRGREESLSRGLRDYRFPPALASRRRPVWSQPDRGHLRIGYQNLQDE